MKNFSAILNESRIDGLVDIKLHKSFQKTAQAIIKDLKSEDFEITDIKKYLINTINNLKG